MRPLLRDDGEGILLDTAVERSFARDKEKGLAEGWLPYRKPWVGIVHVPPKLPLWTDWRKGQHAISKEAAWLASMPHCRGLITFSQWMADWLSAHYDVPVLALKHPTEKPTMKFCWDAYENCDIRGVVQVGWWLRRLSSIHWLPISPRRKRILIPVEKQEFERLGRVLEEERKESGAPPLEEWDCTIVDRLSNEKYDELLSNHVVFLHLHGAVANNAIIECMFRHTPVLVNKLPSVVEYLGEDYPLYWNTLDEAARMAENLHALRSGHQYLASRSLEEFSGERFLQTLSESALYASL